jgi:hypothetical protein
MGCTNISEYIPENCFISLNGKTIDEMVEVVNDIVNNTEDYYNKYMDNILKLKQEFFINPNYNLWEKIKQEIKNL